MNKGIIILRYYISLQIFFWASLTDCIYAIHCLSEAVHLTLENDINWVKHIIN